MLGYLFGIFRTLHQAALDARRRSSSSRYVVWSIASGAALGLALACVLFVAAALWAVGLWIWALVLIGAFVVPICAGPILRVVCVPMGWVKAAHWLGRISSTAGTDPEGHALVVAAWAALSGRRTCSGETVAWLESKRDGRGALGDAEVIATALLVARSDAKAARALLASVPELVERHPAARELAGELLAVDAIERGAWRELLPGAGPAWPASPLRFFLEGLAAVHTGHAGAPTRWGLAARWLVAPQRRHTWAIWRAARAHRAKEAREPAADAAPPHQDEAAESSASEAPAPPHQRMQQAMRQYVTLLATPRAPEHAPEYAPEHAAEEDEAVARRAAELDAVVAAWGSALVSPELLAWTQGRAHELGAAPSAAARALDEVSAAVVGVLRAHIDAFHLPVPTLPPGRFGSALGVQLRHGRLSEVEQAFDHWSARVAGGTQLAPIDEWREFLAVRSGYRTLVASGGDDVRRLVFARVFEATNKVAVILWNQREQYVLAHAILRWQRDEALAVGDSAAIELATKNCKLRVQTRTGDVTP